MITFNKFKSILKIEEDFKTVKQKFISSDESEEDIDNYMNKFRTLSANQRLSGDEKNIDVWGKRSFTDFKEFIKNKETEVTKSGKKKDRGESLDITTPKQQAAGWRIIIPVNKESSCYEGRGTDWCVSKDNHEYYEEYFLDDKVTLIFCLNDKKEKWAIAFYPNNSLDLFDINDKEITKDEFEEKTGLNIKEITDNALKINSKIKSKRKDFSKVRFTKISSDPFVAYNYAINKNAPFPEGEDAIAKNANTAYNYSAFILGKRFPKGEDAISKDTSIAYKYAYEVLRSRFPKGEDAISKDANTSYNYAAYILTKPFPKGEDVIAKNNIIALSYSKYLLKKPFPKGEDAIASDAESAYQYAKDVLKKPFPKGEDAIAKNEMYSALYKQFLRSIGKL